MSYFKFTDFKILDCTVRDGGYINNWHFENRLVKEIYRALSKSGIDYVEIGYRGTEKYFDKKKFGPWRFSREEDISEVISDIKDTKLALMVDYGKIELGDFCKSKDSAVELIRIAFNKGDLKNAIDLSEKIKKKGYKVSLNAMGYTNYTENERKQFINLIKKTELDYIYVADSYGSLFPNQIKPIFEPLLKIKNIKVGFHPHNSLQMAFANTLEAIRCGVHIIDCSIYGIGRAAGNLPTEIIVSYLEKEKRDKYNSIPILNIIDRYFISLHRQKRWGYQLPYMLSGLHQCHPNYAKTLVDLREYTIEDIWRVMDYVKKKNPVGFSKELLDQLIKEGVIGNFTKSSNEKKSLTVSTKIYSANNSPKVSYINRHKNRDFLILANGPSLKEYKDKIDRFIAKYKPIILGANFLGGLFKPHYHAFNNKKRFIEYVETISSESKLLIGEHIPNNLIREYTDRDYETIYYNDVLTADFEIDNGIITTSCRTIAVLLLGVAIVMGAKRIFCGGMDGYIELVKDKFHFYIERDEMEDQEMIIERHRWCQIFLEQIDKYLHKRDREGIHILTPTSYKAYYKGIENYI